MKAKILIVDDDASMRESIDDNLDLEGYDVTQAATGAAALDAVKKEFFDVILMDYNLTDSTGFEVIRNIRTINTDSQILMLTAHASLDTAVKAINESVNAFLTKPIDFGALKKAISNAIEKLRLTQENRRLIQELSYLNQMKSKFLSMSSHDLSNSLMTLQVSFEMLSTTITPTAEQKKRMSYISAGISQIARLIEDLVDWASIEQGKFRLEQAFISPKDLVEEIIIGPQGRAQARDISLTADVQGEVPLINADKRRLGQVLNNLLENAIRHSLKGGRIVVHVSRQGSDVEFGVEDTGEGIAKDEVDKIFQSFYQAGGGKENKGRLGLGLSIAREIVESHKGRIWARSPGLGQGSTFLFKIPAALPGQKIS